MQPRILRDAQDDKPEMVARVYSQGRSVAVWIAQWANHTGQDDKS